MADESTLSPESEKNASGESVNPAPGGDAAGTAALQARIAELEQSVGQVKDQLLRKAAEFENYKRRTENDYAAMVRFSSEEMIARLLPVLDDFERSLKAAKPGAGAGADDASFARGVEMIYQKFRKLLEAHGVKEMEVLGRPFDPALHDALLQVPNSTVPPHTVLEVVDKGYLLHEKVIRHARVIVSADHTEAPATDAAAVH